MLNGIEFDTDRQVHTDKGLKKTTERAPAKGIIGWLLKKQLIPNEAHGRYILFAVIIINFTIAAFMYYFFILE
jgi:hypothetical protein